MMEYHQPVLLEEALDGLAIEENGIYVDVTFGGGGHSKEILRRLKKGKLIAFDQDQDAMENAIQDDRFIMIGQNFKYLRNFLKLHGVLPVNGLLADLGVSSHQFDKGERGFSTRFDADLDMRMDITGPKTAASILNTYEEEDLSRVFWQYGEIKNARRLASAIVKARSEKKIKTTSELKELAMPLAGRNKEHKYLAQVFQALRIEVNDELGALRAMLEQSVEVLKNGGRLVVISYHSLEDRLVKYFMKTGNFEGKLNKDLYGNPIVPFRLVYNKVVVPSEEEIVQNNRARSARLRIAERII